jgi:hypothetical protein
MAKACFCGCGRTVPLHMLGLRTYNTRGEQVAKRISWMRDRLVAASETPDAETQEWLDEGDEIVTLLASIVHRQADPRTINEHAIREWQAEGRAAERETERRGLNQMARFGRAVREGADPLEAAEAVTGDIYRADRDSPSS